MQFVTDELGAVRKLKRLIIIGAGGAGREVYGAALAEWDATWDDAREWANYGFLDANPDALKGKRCALPVLGTPDQWRPDPDEVFVCAIGTPDTRTRLFGMFREKGASFVTIIHPSAHVSGSLGDGSIAYAGVLVGPDAVIGDNVLLNAGANVGHDATVGDGCVLSPACQVLGGAKVGRGVFIGAGAIILPAATIGDGAYIGTGSVVLNPVDPGVKVFGNPARKVAMANC